MNLPPWPDLKRQLDRRGIAEEEIDRAVRYLNLPDPADIMVVVTREEVSFVAIYLTPMMQNIAYHSPLWREIIEGHPAARAIYYHECIELNAYARLGIDDPLLVRRPGRIYSQAHALACYEEAYYWEAWSRNEGLTIAGAAFLRANPIRPENETLTVIDQLSREWHIDVPLASTTELEQARLFYREKRFTREGLNL